MLYGVDSTKPLSFWLKEIWDRGRKGHALARTAAGLSALSPLMALANPTGGQVVAGSAHISTPSANSTLIRETSQNAVINWQQFSVGSNQFVQFLQPDSSAIVLNRVIGGNASTILGDITANGQVFLINPNGILFGRGATLDVSGLVASTQNISNADFMAGRYDFLKGGGAPNASIINQGTITSTRNGYVVLAGDYVENDGVIQAQSGRVLLAAGGATTLTLDKAEGLISYSIDGATLARLAGVRNTGDISAEGGTVIMTADVANALTATAVNNSGFVAARSIQSRDGVIILTAVGGGIDNSGTLDASASQAGVAGGTVILRGDAATELAPSSKIEAGGDGARGGFIELSGHHLQVAGLTDTGIGGNLLLDPGKIHIVAGGASGLGTANTNSIGTSFLAGKLNANQNVTLVASQSIARGGTTSIAINATTGTGNLALKIGTVAVGAGGSLSGAGCILHGLCQPGTSDKFTPTNGSINLAGVTINIAGTFVASAQKGGVTVGTVTAKGMTLNGHNVNYGTLKATASNVNLDALNGSGAGSIVGNTITATHGNVQVNQSAQGGLINIASVSAPSGSINIVTNDAVTGGQVRMGLATAKIIQVRESGATGKMTFDSLTATGARAASASFGGDAVILKAGQSSVTMTSSAKITAHNGGVAIIGGNITLGSVSAGGKLSATAHKTGLGSVNISVLSGKTIQAQAVNLDASGSNTTRITTGAITATGGSIVLSAHHSNPSNFAGISAGNLTATAGGVTVNQSGPHGHLTVGNINAPSGAIYLSANDTGSGGNVSMGGATGKTILVQANATRGADIRVNGPLKAFGAFSTGTSKGMGIILSANATGGANSSGGNVRMLNSSSQAVHALGGGVRLHAHGGLDSGGIVQVSGGIHANGLVDVLSSNVGSCCGAVTLKNVTGQAVQIRANGRGTVINVGAVTATGSKSSGSLHDYVHIYAGSSTAIANGITINGQIKSSHGSASIQAPLAPITVGSSDPVLAATGVRIDGANVTLGSVSAGGFASIHAFNKAPQSATLTVAAGKAIKGGFGVNLAASGSGSDKVSVGNVTATTGGIRITAGGAHGATYGGSVAAGSLTAANSVSLSAHGHGITGGDITVGNVMAGRLLSIDGVHSGASTGLAVKTGTLQAGAVVIAAHGSAATIKTLGVTATGASAAPCSHCEGFIPGYVKMHVIQPGVNPAGSISVAGPVKSSHGLVSFSGGNGAAVKVSGNVTAQKSDGIFGGNITVTGNVTGDIVNLNARNSGSGDIGVTGAVSATTGNVNLQATHFGAAGGNITTGNIGAAKDILLHTRGAGALGGNLKAGTITAGGAVSIGAQYSGSLASAFKVQTGAISGGHVLMLVKGRDPKVSAAGITAFGPSSARYQGRNLCSCESGPSIGSHHGFIGVKITPNGPSGSINITGPVISQNGGVIISASRGAMVTAAISAARNIVLEGNNINVGTVTAGSVASIFGNSVSAAAHIIATGLVKGQRVFVDVNNHPGTTAAAFGGSILLAGGASATGIPSASLSIGKAGIDIRAYTKSSVRMNIATGALTAAGGNVTVKQGGASGSISVNGNITASTGNVKLIGSGSHAGSINVNGAITAGNNITLSDAGLSAGINVAGAIKATGGSVDVRILGSGGISVHSVTAHTALILSGSGNVAGNITVNGNLTAATGPLYVTDSGVAAGITVNGNVAANAGNVFFTANGAGGITVNGNVAAHSGVSIRALGSHAGAVSINGSISGSGEGVFLLARGAGGNNITVNGNITVGITESNAAAELSASAGTHAGGNINVAGTITANNGAVLITAHGGGTSGGRINVGSIVAHDIVRISADYVGTAAGFLVKTGNISAGKSIDVNLSGVSPHFSAGSMKAKGSAAAGNVTVLLDPKGAAKSSGSIKISAPVLSSNGSVILNPGYKSTDTKSTLPGAGTVNTAAITAKKRIYITGDQITVGALGITSGGATLSFSGAVARKADFTVTGAVNAEKFLATMTLASADTHGGSINLLQQVTTTGTGINGTIRIDALDMNPAAAVNLQINTAGLKASNGSVAISQGAAQGGVHATGLISAGGGGLVIGAVGSGGMSLASLSAKGDAILEASGSHGAIKINGNVTAGSSIELIARGKVGKDITVTGNVHARSSVSIHASASGNNSGGNISVSGNISGSTGLVRITTHGGGASGGRIAVGSIDAHNNVNISANYAGTSPGFSVKTGKITGEFVNIVAQGKAPGVTIAGANATGPSGNSCECGNGYVRVQLFPHAPSNSGSINITGPVKSSHGSVTLNAVHGIVNVASSSTGMIAAHRSINVTGGQVHLGSLSAGGALTVNASSAAKPASLTVDGNVSALIVRLTALGSAAGLTVNGNINAPTPPASFSGSRVIDLTANATSNAGGNITVAGAITAPDGRVVLDAIGGGAGGGNINVGNINAHSGATINATYRGSASGAFKVKTGVINAGYIAVGMAGFHPLFSAAGLTGQGMSCECLANVAVRLTNTTFSPALGGSINLTGPVTAATHGIGLNAGFGVVNMGGNSISAAGTFANVRLVGNTLKLANITATGGLFISADAAGSHAASITAAPTSLMTAKAVHIAVGGSGSKGGKISIGKVQATGTGVSSGSGDIEIDAIRSGKPVSITTGGLTAAAAVIMHAQGGSSAGITVAGDITAKTVQLLASGSNSGNINVGNITATGTATGIPNNSVGGSIVVKTAQLLPTPHTRRGVVTTGDLSATGRITVWGTTISVGGVNAGGEMFLSASGTSAKHASVTASKAIVFGAYGSIEANGPSGAINVGNVTATNGSVSFFASGNAGHPGTITAGNVTAKHDVAFFASDVAGRAGTVSVGTVKASDSYVSMSAGKITTIGPVTAASYVSFRALNQINVGGAVTAGAFVEMQGGQISVNGAITAGSQFGVTLPGHSRPVNAGFVKLFAHSASGAASVHVAGDIQGRSVNISAHGKGAAINVGNVTATASDIKISGTVLASSQSASITAGNLSGAHVKVTAAGGNMTVGGITTTASGGASLSAGGSLALAATGNVSLNGGILKAGKAIHMNVGGNLTLNNVALTDSAFSASAGGDLVVSTTGSLNLAGQKVVAGKNLMLTAGSGVKLAHTTIAGSAVNITATNITDSSSGGSITAGGGTLKAASGNINLKSETLNLTAGTGPLLSAQGSVNLASAAVAGAGNLNVHTGTGVDANNITFNGGNLQITAGSALTLTNATVTVGGGARLTAGNSLDITNTSLTARKGVSMIAGRHILIGKTTITAGSAFSATANGSISDGGSAGAITAGSVVLNAKTGDITLTGETLHVGSGKAKLSAGGGIALTSAGIVAGSLSGVTGGSIDLTGATANVSGTLQLVADKEIILSGVHITTGTFLAAASGTIHNGGGPGTITADAISVASKKDINLASTDITLGGGALPSFAGDALLLTELAGFGIGPTSSTLNGAFLADGSLTLGGLTITGHYLALQGTSVAVLGKVTAPTSGLLVQVMPADPTATIGVEGGAATTQAFNMSNTGFFALFPGDTIAVGDDVESGAVFIGANGSFTLADKTNLFFDTTGPVTGLDLITSTGLVTTLEVFVAATGGAVVTVGEIDPNAGSTTNTGLGDETDKKKLGGGGLGGGTGQQGGTISNDDSGTGVCH